MLDVKSIKEKYLPGTRVKLIHMDDPYHPVPDNTCGTVTEVDDVGTVHAKFDNGSGLGICLEVDKVEIIEIPYVRKLYRTGKDSISCYPINEDSVEIKPSSVFDDEFDIIENDEEKDYGYTEISFVEGKYRADCWKHRLPLKEFSTYEEAVNELRECCSYCSGDENTIEEAINDHLIWWCSHVFVEDIKINNIPVFDLYDGEIKNLLDRGFSGNRIFIRRI
jgi:hypothetical protein